MINKILIGKKYSEIDDMFDFFIVTGKYYNLNKKFRIKTKLARYAFCINLWNGRVWGVKDGKRKLLKRVIN